MALNRGVCGEICNTPLCHAGVLTEEGYPLTGSGILSTPQIKQRPGMERHRQADVQLMAGKSARSAAIAR